MAQDVRLIQTLVQNIEKPYVENSSLDCLTAKWTARFSIQPNIDTDSMKAM